MIAGATVTFKTGRAAPAVLRFLADENLSGTINRALRRHATQLGIFMRKPSS
jgi:hypothetical protein